MQQRNPEKLSWPMMCLVIQSEAVLYDHHGELALNPNFRGFQSDADAAADRRTRFGDFFAQFREGYDGVGPSSDVNHDAGFPEFIR